MFLYPIIKILHIKTILDNCQIINDILDIISMPLRYNYNNFFYVKKKIFYAYSLRFVLTLFMIWRGYSRLARDSSATEKKNTSYFSKIVKYVKYL